MPGLVLSPSAAVADLSQQLSHVGHALERPECVMCASTGDTYVSHFGGGVTRIQPDGTQTDYLGPGDPKIATNGFALLPDGGFLCANLLPPGGVWRVGRDGTQTPFVTEVDGIDLPSVNFVHVDRAGRTWITISTRQEPRSLGYRHSVADGFVILVDKRGARVVAQDLGYTNEAKVDPSGQWLYLNETFARRTSRFAITADGLGARETVAEYGAGTFPDGLDFDVEGGIWISSIISNRVIRLTPDGQQSVVIEDLDAEFVADVEKAYQAETLGRPHLDNNPAPHLKNISSVAFGGPDLKTIYMGCLLEDRIYKIASPVAGAVPPHWDFGA